MNNEVINIACFLKKDIFRFDEKEFLETQKEEASTSIKDTACHYYISLSSCNNKSYCFLYSGTYNTRSGDLLRYLNDRLPQFAFDIVKEANDVSKITSWCLAVQLASIELSSALESKIQTLAEQYEAETIIIDAATFFTENKMEITGWSLYRKQALPRCYVSLQQIKEKLGLKDNCEIVLKTLENESGVTLQCSNDVMIMLGTQGEPYDIERQKFDELYQPIEYDIGNDRIKKELSQDYDMLLKVVVGEMGEEIDLLDYGLLCVPKKINQVYAMQITEGIYKIFSTRITGTNQYYLGQKNMWVTVDEDFPVSVHVVDAAVFAKSYEIV